MSTKTKIGAGVGAAVLALVLVFAWYFFGSSPDEAVSLDAAVGAIADSSELPEGQLTAQAIQGSWNVQPNDTGEVSEGSFVGYRIVEELNNVGNATATGRTTDVVGELTIEGGQLTAATLTADMTSLQSDRSQRDRALATRGIEYGQFPEATFTLTQPVSFDVEALTSGAMQVVTVEGELDLHGVVQPYTVDLEVKAVGVTVVVVGAVEVDLTAHDISKPVVGPVLAIADTGTIEFQVFFTKV